MKYFRQNIYARGALIVIGAILLFGVVSFGARSNMRWQSHQYFGEIAGMTDAGFILSEGKAGERIIDTTPDVVVRRGIHKYKDNLQVGDQVIVVGENAPDRHVRATLIRVVEGKKWNKLLSK